MIYSINQTFFSTSVINDEQYLLENKFNVSDVKLSELRNKNIATDSSLNNLSQTDEFQESVISIATKNLKKKQSKSEFLPHVVWISKKLSSKINQ